MGNKNSSKSKHEDKGPFSDQEYDNLKSFYESMTSNAKHQQNAVIARFKERFSEYIGSDKSELIDMPCFMAFVGKLYQVLANTRSDNRVGVSILSFSQLLDGVASLTRSSRERIISSFFRVFDEEACGSLKRPQLQSFFTICYSMALCQLRAVPSNIGLEAIVGALVDGVMRDSSGKMSNEAITEEKFCSWINSNLPLLYSIIADFIAGVCLGNNRASYCWPSLLESSAAVSGVTLFAISMSSIDLQRPWDRLFTSTKDGLSFNRMCFHVLGYRGPTLTAVCDSDGDVFAMYADSEWQESNTFYGGGNCMIFRLAPYFAVYRTKTTGTQNWMYLNTKGFALPHGIGMGGSINDFRVFLDEDFEACVSKASCLSFDSGAITRVRSFQVDVIEIWGCGGVEARSAQSAHREETAKLIDKARKVDKAKFAESGFDREHFLSKTFGHQAGARATADDEH